MTTTAILISTLALLFTTFSFWWQNWRSGKVIIGAPRTYAAFADSNKLLIHLPFVFYNSGPRPKLIDNLRVEIEGYPEPLIFNATIEKLASSDNRKYATQFPLHGNKAEFIICEFTNNKKGFRFEAKNYQVRLMAIVNEGDSWVCLKEFSLVVSQQSIESINGKAFIAHDNHKW